ncbi:MAG TPA: DoxX family membrane protein [Candidatus Dormibacteraeota bacterium]|nr:DoxX family membrane protein [Candidatus Dormibacteraeota bacterium]
MSDRLEQAWPSLLRIVVALYWLYFASQKWNGVDWMRSVIKATADANPIPGLHQFLEGVVVPNWFLFATAQGAGETVVGVLLLFGVATRWAALLGVLLAANLAFTVAFAVNDDGFRWLYWLGLAVNAQVVVSGAGPVAIGRFRWVPAYLR